MRYKAFLTSTTLSTYALSLLLSSVAMAAGVHVEVPVVRPKVPSVVIKPNAVVVKPGSVLIRPKVVNRTAVIHDHDLRSMPTRQDRVKGDERISTETEILDGATSTETVPGGGGSSTPLSPTMVHWISGHYTSTIAYGYGKSGPGIVEYDLDFWNGLSTTGKVLFVISPAYTVFLIGSNVLFPPSGTSPSGTAPAGGGGGGGAPSGGKAVNTVEQAKTESGSGGTTITTTISTTTTTTVTKSEGGGGGNGGGVSGGPPVNTAQEAQTVSGAPPDNPTGADTTTNARGNPKTDAGTGQ
jgi:hypothetical protein